MNHLVLTASAVAGLTASVILSGCSVTDPAPVTAQPTATTSPSAPAVFLYECEQRLVSRPTDFATDCGNSGRTRQSLTQLKWNSWGGRAATATGTRLQTCTANCKTGKRRAYPVTVTATDPVAGEEATIYTTLTFGGKDPQQHDKVLFFLVHFDPPHTSTTPKTVGPKPTASPEPTQ